MTAPAGILVAARFGSLASSLFGSQVWQPHWYSCGSPRRQTCSSPTGNPSQNSPTIRLRACSPAGLRPFYLFLSLFPISFRSLNERVCQNDNRTNSAKLTLRACFVKLTLRACSVKLLLPVCCCCRLFSPAARASSSATAPRPAPASRWNSAATPWLATAQP